MHCAVLLMLRAIAEFEPAAAVLVGWPLALPPSLLQRFAEHVNVIVVLDEAELPAARAQLSATVPNHRLVLVPHPRPAGSTRGADDRWRRTSTR